MKKVKVGHLFVVRLYSRGRDEEGQGRPPICGTAVFHSWQSSSHSLVTGHNVDVFLTVFVKINV